LKSDLEKSIRKTLAEYPVTFRFGQRGKHPFVEIDLGSRKCRMSFGSQTGDAYRASLNNRARLRGMMRAHGVEPITSNSGHVR
jgi:hypothetical protein